MGFPALVWSRKRPACALFVCFCLFCGLVAYYRISQEPEPISEEYGHVPLKLPKEDQNTDTTKFKLPEEELLSEAEKEAVRAVFSPTISTEPSRVTSSLHWVHGGETDSEHDRITARLDLSDASGRQIRYGGHQVRMWITSAAPNKKSAAIPVTDLRNGSYVSSFPVLWPGETVVHAAMIYPRDLHYALTKMILNVNLLQPLVGIFVRGKCRQSTPCGPHPVIPGYPTSCNHTSLNTGLGWYCGKPDRSCLSCEDLKFTQRLNRAGYTLPFQTEAERDLNYWYLNASRDSSWSYNVKQILTIRTNARPPPEPRVPCSAIKPRDTWTDQSPRGFLDNGTWHSLVCAPPPWDVNSLTQCFRGATFLFLGDSNARLMFEAICELLDGYVHVEEIINHVPLFCEKIKRRYDVELAWLPHEYPFQGAKQIVYDMSVKKSPRYHMDRIPATGKYVILVHLFAHFGLYSSSVYTEHVQDAVRGARDLCRRNPSVKIVIRGPTCWVNAARGDYLTTMTRDVLMREFRALRDCVVYLDSWDVTLAADGCYTVHPPFFATKQLTRMFLGHVCSGT